jgi:hypothetical protein
MLISTLPATGQRHVICSIRDYQTSRVQNYPLPRARLGTRSPSKCLPFNTHVILDGHFQTSDLILNWIVETQLIHSLMRLKNTCVVLLIQYSQEQTGVELDGAGRPAGILNPIPCESLYHHSLLSHSYPEFLVTSNWTTS